MKLFVRILIGVLGAIALAAAANFWLRPIPAGAMVGLSIANATGAATIRADIAGFFAASGVFALVGAVRASAPAALAALVMMAFALFGRVVNIALSGWDPIFLPPMAIEAVTIGVFALAYRTLNASR